MIEISIILNIIKRLFINCDTKGYIYYFKQKHIKY